MKRTFTILFFIVFTYLSFAQNALIEIDFTFTDGLGGSRVLTAGLDPTATDGLDNALGETALPPPPFGFYARFELPGATTDSWKDFREGDTTASSIGNKVHNVKYQLGTGSAGLNISWDLPDGVELNLQDPFGGVLFNQDFPSGTGNYTITNTSLTRLQMTIKYVDPPFPVELISFAGTFVENTVVLNWSTATEINNYGFDIERLVNGETWQKISFIQGYGNSNSPKNYSYVDNNINKAGKYKYRLKQIDINGQFKYFDEIIVFVKVPNAYLLRQNYPNPFNPTTIIRYNLPQPSHIILEVFDVLGNNVQTLVNENKEAGIYNVIFDASNLSAGVYYYRIQAEGFNKTYKMILLR